MSANEEVEEHVHHAQGHFDKLVAGCMAFIAASLAVVSVFGQHYNTEKLLSQQQASDQWAYYQAKDIRRYTAQVAADLFSKANANAAMSQKYLQDASRYKQQTSDIQDKARELEHERDKMDHQADGFHVGEVFLELGIVLSSLSILTKRKYLFYSGLGCAVTGILISGVGWWWYSLPGHA